MAWIMLVASVCCLVASVAVFVRNELMMQRIREGRNAR